jgi:hypothetical protein
MYSLTVKGAFAYVRRAIDELTTAEEIGHLVDPDAIDLHRLVEGAMVEAVVKTYSLAPSHILEGETAVKEKDYELELKDKVVTISMLTPTARVVSVQCNDSEVILSDLIPENSAEGRKQLNKYIRGTYDDPRLVLLKNWNGDNMPRMRYYTTTKELKDLDFTIEFLPYPVLEEGVVKVASRLEYVVLNFIVALVLDSFKEFEAADRFRVKAKEYMEG